LEAVVKELVDVVQQQIVLSFPDPAKRFFIISDASDVGWGALVGQLDDIEASLKEVPIEDRHPELLGCVSGTWPQGQTWSTNRREAYAVVEGLRSQVFLEDSLKPVLVLCDNSSVVGLFNSDGERSSQAKQALRRLHEAVYEYKLELSHIPGELNALADYLSRPRGALESGDGQHLSVYLSSESGKEIFAVAKALHWELGHARGPVLDMRLKRKLGAQVDARGVAREVDKYCLRCQMSDRRVLMDYGIGLNELYGERGDCFHLDLKTSKDPCILFCWW
jgi:hypothetical protein